MTGDVLITNECLRFKMYLFVESTKDLFDEDI
jgi:hypothetical protein